MATLRLIFNGELLGVHEIEREETCIGRRPANDIQIDNLAVSGYHARLLQIGEDIVIEDLGSTNGTYVNGESIHKKILHDGDVIRLGKHQIWFEDRAATEEEDNFERTMIIKRGSAQDSYTPQRKSKRDQKEAPQGRPSEPISDVSGGEYTGDSSLTGHAVLKVISGANKGKELELNKALTTLGKPGLQVAAITRRASSYHILHVEGDERMPPKINGQPVGRKARQLDDGCVLEVAGVRMEFLRHRR